MEFLQEIESDLKQKKYFIAEDGNLIKAKVYDACMAMDKELLRLLLENETTKEHFFVDIDGTLVFDKLKFAWVLESRAFLPDSYTRFKNKLGLINEKGDLISKSDNVTLVWPYKDCILEGGQTKEDQKRDEIFYNETLAPDEKDRLLYPKVFTNATKYTTNGEKAVTSIQDNDNLIIKGNNLLALSSLLKRYEEKVKCIYIDPPYYFPKKKEVDAFTYNSNFKLSTWLTFMKDRLILAKRMLSDSGAIFVNMGDDGIGYLRVLLDEIFGQENYKGMISWRKTDNQSNIGDFAKVTDYIAIYCKNKGLNKFGKMPLSQKAIKEYSYTDEKGRFRRMNLYDKTRGRFYYEIETPNGNIIGGPWMVEEHEFNLLSKQNKIFWPEGGNSTPYGKIYLKDKIEDGQISNDYWGIEFGTNQRGADEINVLFGKRLFDYAKPERLIFNILSISSVENDIVMDFNLGSGTTAAVAHKMNRQYIGVEQMDYINTVTVTRLQKVIQGEQGGISKEVDWQGGGAFVYCELKELNEGYVTAIQKAKTDKELDNIKKEILKTGFISHKIEIKDINNNAHEYKALSFSDKQRFLLEILDKNKLYVNYCDIDDEEMKVSDKEKAFTNSFYGKEGY